MVEDRVNEVLSQHFGFRSHLLTQLSKYLHVAIITSLFLDLRGGRLTLNTSGLYNRLVSLFLRSASFLFVADIT